MVDLIQLPRNVDVGGYVVLYVVEVRVIPQVIYVFQRAGA